MNHVDIVGDLIETYSETVPHNWLRCEGQELNRKQYAKLFSVLGTKHGEGNGTTTFNLPKLSGSDDGQVTLIYVGSHAPHPY